MFFWPDQHGPLAIVESGILWQLDIDLAVSGAAICKWLVPTTGFFLAVTVPIDWLESGTHTLFFLDLRERLEMMQLVLNTVGMSTSRRKKKNNKKNKKNMCK